MVSSLWVQTIFLSRVITVRFTSLGPAWGLGNGHLEGYRLRPDTGQEADGFRPVAGSSRAVASSAARLSPCQNQGERGT